MEGILVLRSLFGSATWEEPPAALATPSLCSAGLPNPRCALRLRSLASAGGFALPHHLEVRVLEVSDGGGRDGPGQEVATQVDENRSRPDDGA